MTRGEPSRLAALVAAAAALVCCLAPAAFAGASDPASPTPTLEPRPGSPAAMPPGAPSAQPQGTRARGGVALLASALRARAVVTGAVSHREKVDLHGWSATLRTDRVLLGPLQVDDDVKIAWEELSSSRRVRFDEGERALVVLDPLPTQSLWRKRFPRTGSAPEVFVVAANGEAFLREPDDVTLDALEHYLAVVPEARDAVPGVLRLVELAASAEPGIAGEAFTLLETRAAMGAMIDADGAAVLLKAARASQRDRSLRARALRLAAAHDLPGTREAALALSKPPSTLRPDAFRALAALPGGLAPQEVNELLDDSDAEVRIVGIEQSVDPARRPRLVEISRRDQSPVVRLAAGQALVARYGVGAIADVAALLDDGDATVRGGIATAVGSLGTPAVGPLREVVDNGSERAALAAVLGLSRAGEEGGVALYLISNNHANETVRAFARLALGKAPGHTH